MHKFNLLPRIFKLIGLSIFILPIITLAVFKFTNIENAYSLISKPILQSVMILGLTLIIFSKDKMEDERNNLLRLQAFAFSFIIIIVQFLISPLLQINYTNVAFSMVLQMCFVYLIYFTFSKYIFINKMRNDK